MDTRGFLFLSLFFSLSFYGFCPPAANGSLVIEVDNIKTTEGIIWVGIYDSASSFLVKEKAIVEGFSIKKQGKLQMTFPELPFGTYAIALFHDINNNGELDRNFIGIPSEPFAFSRRPRSKWRVPRFDEVKFDFHDDGQILHTHLKKWWD
jgi:uncharacterized protein (DUF2141 family)